MMSAGVGRAVAMGANALRRKASQMFSKACQALSGKVVQRKQLRIRQRCCAGHPARVGQFGVLSRRSSTSIGLSPVNGATRWVHWFADKRHTCGGGCHDGIPSREVPACHWLVTAGLPLLAIVVAGISDVVVVSNAVVFHSLHRAFSACMRLS